MFIKTQNEKNLVNVDKVEIFTVCCFGIETNNVNVAYGNDSVFTIGEYNSTRDALKVIDDIMEAIERGEKIYIMPQKDEVKDIKVLSVTLNKKSKDVGITKFVEVYEFNNNVSEQLSQMHKIIGCDCVTCTEIKVKDRYYDVWSNDEALLKEESMPMLYLNDDKVIFGNIIFARADEEGNMKGLDNYDIDNLIQYYREQESKLQNWFHSMKN